MFCFYTPSFYKKRGHYSRGDIIQGRTFIKAWRPPWLRKYGKLVAFMGNIMRLLGTRPGTRLVAKLIGIDTYNISSCTCFTYFHMQRTLTGFSIYYMSMPRRLNKSGDGCWLNWGQITITKRKKCIFLPVFELMSDSLTTI